MKQSKISIIVPALNEEANIQPLVERIHHALSPHSIEYEVVFIDDSSTDGTVVAVNMLRDMYPVSVYSKKGTQGKAYSLLEGFAYAQYDAVGMIDADLQYPPEAIPEMLARLDERVGVVVANRVEREVSFVRRFFSKTFRVIFGTFLHGLKCDVQSGLKVFKRNITREISISPTPWTFDMEFLLQAREAGYDIASVDIDFNERTHGESKVNVLKTSIEIGFNALRLKLRKRKPIIIPPDEEDTMKGAGIAYKRRRFITHTTLPIQASAFFTFTKTQKLLMALLLFVFAASVYAWPIITAVVSIAVLSVIYLSDALFNFFLVTKSLAHPPELKFSDKQLASIDENELPIYTILCPLFRESSVLPIFLKNIDMLDYPKDKLDVLLLLEEKDAETIETARSMDLPSYVRIVIVPASQPQTKPKACNYGLAFARGEYLVIYDAEDKPDPWQLKKVYLGFQNVASDVRCLQCKLNYFNTNQNLLTRLFTAEYSLWFDVVLPGLQSINTSIPLGGTSNHFRTKDLIEFGGWDPFNVTEDADLGTRLFTKGYKTAIVESVTLEEANSQAWNWIRQRSRWIKGYMQTYLVHMRHPFQFWKKAGWHMFAFQMNVGGKIAFMLINPILWATTISYFLFRAVVGPLVEPIYPSAVLYIATTSLVFGNFFYMYYYMIGCAKRQKWNVIKYVLFIPVYWVLMSIAALMALYQLFIKPHFWEKTKHGLHLNKTRDIVAQPMKRPNLAHSSKSHVSGYAGINFIEPKFESTDLDIVPVTVSHSEPEIQRREEKQPAISGTRSRPYTKNLPSWGLFGYLKNVYKRIPFGISTFVVATMVANIINLLFNIFLGNQLSFEELGLVVTINTLWGIAAVIVGAVGATANHGSAYLSAEGGKAVSLSFYRFLLKRGLIYSAFISILWLVGAPYIAEFFNISDIRVIFLFTPIFTFGLLAASSRGFLKGNLFFEAAAYTLIFESVAKFAAAALFIYYGFPEWTYAAIPISVFVGAGVAVALVSMRTPEFAYPVAEQKEHRSVADGASPEGRHVFPYKFYGAALLAGIATTIFLSLDIILVKHFLDPDRAGQYALLSLAGKMVYFLASLPNVFTLTFVSRDMGLRKSADKTFFKILTATFVLAVAGFMFVGIAGDTTIPFIFGEKATAVTPFLFLYAAAMVFFALMNVIVSFHLARKEYAFPAISIVFTLFMAAGISIFHGSLQDIVGVVFVSSAFGFITLVGIHVLGNKMQFVKRGIIDLRDAFVKNGIPVASGHEYKRRILVFNWRDMKHSFAGGAEMYIHELAKRWIKQGNQVTVFAGNDGQSVRHEVKDGVHIIRRGGFYLVYVWAFLYYITKFRGKFDIIIDCHNGIPFFTPLYAKEPVFCLMHHVHQEVFRHSLVLPLALVAVFLEKILMPFVYRNVPIITVSESSKNAIEKLNLGLREGIAVAPPGIEPAYFSPDVKSTHPTIVYLGRLKAYKSIDVLLKAFADVAEKIPSAELIIAGSGEEEYALKKLAKELGIDSRVRFTGKISDKKKYSLLQKAWVFVNPSFMEGWGITTIEANACGTPVVASDVPGLRDSVVNGKTGYLVEYGDSEALAKKLVKLIRDERMFQYMSENAVSWAENFSWDKTNDNFIKAMNGYWRIAHKPVLHVSGSGVKNM